MTTPDPHEAAPLRIVAAAIQFRGVVLTEPPPARHHHLLWSLAQMWGEDHISPDEQGFLASNGLFYTRRAALDIAWAAGQLERRKKHGVPSELYSEDLW